jgi:hypothetical protein
MDMLRESLHSGAPVETLEMAGRVETALERWTVAARRTLEGMESTTIDSENGDEVARSEAVLSVLETVKVRRAQAERSRQMRERLTNECDEIEATLRHKGRALAIASRAYLTFIRVKNHEIQSIFNDLQSDLVHFYDFLHPEEGHGALSIAMDPQKRGSSELKMDFFDRREEDPRAFGSEGHLDSLGLCIFLAFARRFNGDWPLLVLDDVVASVDASHKRRVAALLFREFGDRQLLITTHDARWFNDLRGAEAESGQAARTRNLVIESWTLEEGPRLRTAV